MNMELLTPTQINRQTEMEMKKGNGMKMKNENVVDLGRLEIVESRSVRFRQFQNPFISLYQTNNFRHLMLFLILRDSFRNSKQNKF